MNKTTPFLAGFSALLCGRSKTATQSLLSEKRRKLLEGGGDLQHQFLDEIDPALLERFSSTQRLRNYPDPLVFWSFLLQVLRRTRKFGQGRAKLSYGWRVRERVG